MRCSFTAPIALAPLAIAGLLACHSDPAAPPPSERSTALQIGSDRTISELGSGGNKVLVVDNDGADCPNANYTSIQAAVAAAGPGASIVVCAGTYVEWVVIENKTNLRLLAKGQPGEVILDGQNIAGANCSPASTTASQCAGFELRNADGNLIEGFLVKRYWEAGIWLRTGSDGNTIRKNVTTGSPHHDGIQVAASANNVIEHNLAFSNFAPALNACGINVQTASSGNIVRHNESFDNDFGIQINSGALNNVVFENESHDNRRVGIRNISGSDGTKIENNRVFDNGGTGQFGGIRLLGSTGVTVARNKAFNNMPVDLFWDGTGSNLFENNHCRTSFPPGLCEHTEGESKD